MKFRTIRFFALALCLVFAAGTAMAQMTTTGRLIGTVTDPTGAVVVGADVKAVDEATGKTYETKSGNDGGFTFPALQPGSYTIMVTMQGFKKTELRALKVVVGGQHGLTVKLELGEVASTVVIEAGTEVLQTSETKVGTTITGKVITQLPFSSRDALDLAILMPGASTVGRPRSTSFMGLPKGAINITMDGINAQDQVLKSSDGFFTLIRPRVDTIEEFSISTAAAGANESGEGAVQIRFETKRGGNDFHGGAWWYHRNDKFNSNYYFNNEVAPGQTSVRKQRQRLNQFGAKVGGPIIKDKLFFFTAVDFYRNPESRTRTRTILTTEAASGRFRYPTVDSAGNPVLITPTGARATWTTCGPTQTPGTTGFECVVDLMKIAAAASPALPTNFDTYTLFLNNAIQSVRTAGVSFNARPSRWQESISFNNGGAGRRNFPDFRFDYNLNKSQSITAIYHYNYFTSTPDFLNGFDYTYPVDPFNTNLGSQISNRNELVAAWRWNMSTNKTNEVRIGLISSPVAFFPDMNINLYPQGATALGPIRLRYSPSGSSAPLLGFSIQGRNGGILQLIDTFSWTRGKHNFTFGGNWTEVLYKDYSADAAVGGLATGVVTADSAAVSAFSSTNMPGINTTQRGNARALWASLTGRVTSFSANKYFNPFTREFEQGAQAISRVKQTEIGLYGTDNWRLFSTLTLNAGVRWEYQGSFRDNLDQSFRVDGDVNQAIAGRSCAISNLFTPGGATCPISSYTLNGDKEWWNKDLNNFAPSLGLAWTPNLEGSLFKMLFGGPGKSVFRAGYSISFTREGVNNFFSIAGANPGGFSSQSTRASNTVAPGFFKPGTVSLQSVIGGSIIPNVLASPETFVTSRPIDTISDEGVNVFDPNLSIPYVQSWQVGWQREITPSTVFEVRYVGNHGTGLWRQFNLNEVNIFENGFLTEFGRASNNLSICRANSTQDPVTGAWSGPCITAQQTAGVAASDRTGNSYANWGLSGQVALPISTGAFTGTTSTGAPAASGLTGSCAPPTGGVTSGQCDANFASPDRTSNLDLGLAGSFGSALAGNFDFWQNIMAAGFPANFWVLNPDAIGGGAWLFGNQTHTTYNGLQIEFRRKPAKGLQYSGSYVFAKSLSNYFGDSSVSADGFSTMRNPGRNKSSSPWDIRHAFKLQLIYEMPFGPGKKWSSSQGWVNRIIEGWEINTITRWQSGRVFNVSGGLGGTFNGNDGGVELIGTTPKQIQESLGIRKTADGKVFFFPEALIGSDGTANSEVMKACSTPGQFCHRLFLYGPSFFRADWSLGKRTKISEKVNIEFRAEFLNAFNTANFFFGGTAATTVASTNLQTSSFGQVTNAYQDTSTTDDPGGRIIQMVLRINF